VLCSLPRRHGSEASERWPNLTLKKIPKMVLARCEWGHDDYSLNVANLPMAQIDLPDATDQALPGHRVAPALTNQTDLFGSEPGE